MYFKAMIASKAWVLLNENKTGLTKDRNYSKGNCNKGQQTIGIRMF